MNLSLRKLAIGTNLTIGKKLGLCFALVLILLGIVTIVSYTSLTAVVAEYQDLSNRIDVANDELRHLEAKALGQEAAVLGFMTTQSDVYRQNFEENEPRPMKYWKPSKRWLRTKKPEFYSTTSRSRCGHTKLPSRRF